MKCRRIGEREKAIASYHRKEGENGTDRPKSGVESLDSLDPTVLTADPSFVPMKGMRSSA